MKTKAVVYLLTLLSWSAYAQHNHGSAPGNPPAHGRKENRTHPDLAPIEFQLQLRAVVTASLELKESLVASDDMKASASVPEIQSAISKVDMSMLKEEGLMDWLINLKIVNENLDVIVGSSDLTAQRKAFALFSNALYKSLKTFGSAGTIIYYDYCPMANSHAGAYWLSESKEIRNPYLGSGSLTCGKVIEILQ